MSVIIESIESYDARSGPGDRTKFMVASVGSVQTVVTNIRFETYIMPSTINSGQEPLFFIQTNPFPRFTGKRADDSVIHTNNTKGWKGWKVGDNYLIKDSGTSDGVGIIEEISEDGQTLITNQTYTIRETLPLESAYIAITTPQQSLEFLFNWIENELPEDYISIIDSETQRALVGQLDFSDTITEHTMVMQGKLSWQFGTITVKGNGTGGGNDTLEPGVIQAFTITHETLVSPLILFNEWNDFMAGIAPERLRGGNSLKYINSIGLSSQVNDPNDITLVSETSMDGNVGWHGENLNGGINNYRMENLVYKRLDNTITESLELTTTESKIQFSIINDIDSPFLNGVSIVIPAIHFAPSDASQYRDNTIAWSQTQDYNFIFDQVVEIVGSGGTAIPRQFGTDTQSFKSCSSVIVTPSQIDFDIRMQFDVNVVARIGVNEDQRYAIFVEVANDLLSRADTDKVSVPVDANEYFTDVSDPGLITMGNKFMTHPFSNIDTQSVDFVVVKPEDELLSINDIVMDKNGRETDSINFTQIKGEIIVRKNTGASFIVDSRVIALNPELIESAPFGGIAKVNLNISRGFKTPSDENRGNIKFFNQYTLDAGGFFHWRFQFPHGWRWEGYISVDRPKDVDDHFFDPNQPQEGRNQDWFRYSNDPEWDIYYRVTLNVLKNGGNLPFFFDQKVDMLDYLASPDWINEEIKSYDENDVELVDGVEGFINGGINGTLKTRFTWDGGTTPDIDDIEIEFKIYAFEEGTYKSRYTLSSAYDAHPNTYFTSIDTSNRVVVFDEGGGVFRGECVLIGSRVPLREKYSITARIYDKRGILLPGPPAIPKLMEDGTPKKMDGSGTFKIME